jgi:hypothetical protein
MSWKLSLVGVLAVAGVAAGCATTSDPYSPSASTHPSRSPHSLGPVRTDGPQIDNADAAGPASVPGTRTGVAPVVITPPPPAASPVIIVPPAEPAPPAVVVPAPQPR